MESSDDENEVVPEFVSNYYFVDDDESAISFSVLPICWTTNETMQTGEEQIDLHGTTDGGLQKFFKRVKAWKFDISGDEPEVSVLFTDNNWMKVQKPRKSYQETIKSVLVTVNFLHLVKKDPKLDQKAVWRKLFKIFSLYDDRPSKKDIRLHRILIEEAVKRDESLKKSEHLMMFLERKAQNSGRTDEDISTKEKKGFIVDDSEEEDDSGEEEDDASEEEKGDEASFDSVCCICDNGGKLLCCEGVCMRSFHATQNPDDTEESQCVSLGFTEKEVKNIPNFKCKNCQYKQHLCFICGKLGSSDTSSVAEVFQCANATCGYFYHPRCVARLLHRDSEVAAKELQDKILTGESFACPLHTCFVCKQPENEAIPELKMAVCRRCPKAYHAKCLPKKIAFEEDEEQDIQQRAWDGLLPGRILMYCLKHEIDEDLGTPARNHVKFPGDAKKEKQSSTLALTKNANFLIKKRPLTVVTSKIGSATQSKKSSVQVGNLDKKTDIKSPKLKAPDVSRKISTEKKSVVAKNSGSFVAEKHNNSLGNALHALYTQSDYLKPRKPEKPDEDEMTKTSKPVLEPLESRLDSDSERRILDMMKEAKSIITMDDIVLKHNDAIPSRAYRHKSESKNKNITQGKVDCLCKAIREASKKLDEGGNIEDAKNICDSRNFNQVVRWKNMLRVYLAPFLNGMRYTSYGRHFTKNDKLKEIVDKIHLYVNSGDTIVDFCCGSNDFSWFMKQKLEQTGKSCSYKNYDLFRPKNDFCFERRDWLASKPDDLRLPTGSQLIMGLNPPFGVRAALANQFINKALEFKPKLLILIVPPETERLDKKQTPYDLVWEDFEKLSGKSFYLPGSVDVNDQQVEDWNKVTPVLYLWSRSDWTAKHKKIAEKHGHLPGMTEDKLVHHSPHGNQDQRNDRFPQDILPEGLEERVASLAAEALDNRPAHVDLEKGKLPIPVGSGNKKKKAQRRAEQRAEKRKRDNDSFPVRMQKQPSPTNPLNVRPRLTSPSKPDHSGPHILPDPTLDGKRSQEGHSSMHQRSPSDMEIDDSSHDLPIENPTHPTSYDVAANGRSSSLAIIPNVDPTVEPSQPTGSYGRSLGYDHERIGPVDPTKPTSFDAAVYGRAHDRYQHGVYRERINPYTAPEADPFSGRRERWPMEDVTPRPGSGYIREAQDFGFNQPIPHPQSEAEMRYRPPSYSMGGSTYNSRMNSMPVSERYALRLDDRNHPRMDEVSPMMARDAGGGSGRGMYDYHDPRPRRANDPMGFATGPVNYYPPHSGPRGGWLNE